MKQKNRRLAWAVAFLLALLVAYYIWDVSRERSQAETLAEIIHLEDSRASVDQFSTYLADDTISVRAKAALAIGRIGRKNAGETLFKLITTDVDDVAVQAAFAIGLTDESSYAEKLLDVGFDLYAKQGH